jgi:hypothetical protein
MRTKFIIQFVCLSLVLFSTPVHAYLDPSTGSYIIQAIAGVILAGGAAIAYQWKKIISKVKGKEKKDEK